MHPPPPKVDVELRVDPPTCDLSRQTRFSFLVLLTLHCKQSVSILRNSYDAVDFGLVYLLQSGTIECIDSDSGARIPIFSHRRRRDSASRDHKTQRPHLMALNNNTADCVTFTSDPEPAEYELGLDTSQLRPGRNYTIRSSPWDLGWWSYDSVDECLAYFDKHGDLPQTQLPPLHCSPGNMMVTFACKEENRTPEPPPPQVDG